MATYSMRPKEKGLRFFSQPTGICGTSKTSARGTSQSSYSERQAGRVFSARSLPWFTPSIAPCPGAMWKSAFLLPANQLKRRKPGPCYSISPSRKANVIRTQKMTMTRRMVSRSRLSTPASIRPRVSLCERRRALGDHLVDNVDHEGGVEQERLHHNHRGGAFDKATDHPHLFQPRVAQ